MKTNKLMLYGAHGAQIAVCSLINKNHINAETKKAKFLNIKPAGASRRLVTLNNNRY
jgi:hypothetical protein